MNSDVERFISGVEYLAQMASHPWTPKNVLDSIKEGLAMDLEQIVAARIETAISTAK